MSDTLPPDALAAVPELPRATPVAGEPAPPPATLPADPGKDDAGEAWNPAVHVDPPTRNSKGRWKCRLRGNAARLARGLPMVGVAAGKAPRPAPPPPDPTPTPGASGQVVDALPPATDAPPAAAGVSRLVWDEPGADPAAAPGAPAPEALRPREAYATTAKGIVRAQFAVATIAIGPAWDAPPAERAAWTEAWQDFLHEHQWPVLGSAVALIVLLVESIAKRRNDPDTQQAGARLRDLVLGRFTRRPVVAVDAAPAPAPVAPAALARPTLPEPVNPLDGAGPGTRRVTNPYGDIGK